MLDFIDQIQQSIHCKLPPEDLRYQFVQLLVWEGMNADHRMACAGLRDGLEGCG